MVSYRWINFCIDRRQIVRDLKKHRLPNLLPNIQPMPLKDFKDIQVLIKGFDEHQKYVLRETVKILGGKVVEWQFRADLKLSKEILVLCTDSSKIQKILKTDSEFKTTGLALDLLKFKHSSWLFKTQFSGKVIL